MMPARAEHEQFSVVENHSDHYFRNFEHYTDTKKHKHNNKDDYRQQPTIITSDRAVRQCFTNTHNAVYKKIMKEWKILARSLPESIFVRVYEKRIDLMRAVIQGAAGTPYHDGLYFFDIAFPPDYPNHPPIVHYHSFGHKINPNLYHDGKVCLSLINTWLGKKNEKWVPSDSTVLQLLVSLQALVLNDTPYFNEVGSEILGRRIFEKRARFYNEMVFVLNCKTMMSLIQRPPCNFEDIIFTHFRTRACEILRACDHYVNGRVRVGWYGVVGECSGSSRVKVSKEFKVAMVELYPRLFKAFARTLAMLDTIPEVLEMAKNDDKSNGLSKKGQGGHKKHRIRKIVRKVFGKIRKFYASSELNTPHRLENNSAAA